MHVTLSEHLQVPGHELVFPDHPSESSVVHLPVLLKHLLSLSVQVTEDTETEGHVTLYKYGTSPRFSAALDLYSASHVDRAIQYLLSAASLISDLISSK